VGDHPFQYAAGTLAASAFITVTQILTGVALDLPLMIALALFATNIPPQAMLFFTPAPESVPKDANFSQAEWVYWRLQQVSTTLILLGFAATFWHFAWWLGVLFAASSYGAWRIFKWWAYIDEPA
jgi:hypothetical protein